MTCKMKVPHWETTYEDDTVFLFGSEPNDTIVAFEALFDKSMSVLDAGCGDGRNSLYLAKQGFSQIDAFDLSEHAIGKLKRLSQKNGVLINAWAEDLYKFSRYKVI